MDGEILEVNSGKMLVLDQFMLTSDLFLEQQNVEDFGGIRLDLASGTYRVARQNREKLLLVYKLEQADISDLDKQADMAAVLAEQAEYEKERAKDSSALYIDTRCLVFIDQDYLSSSREVLEKALELRRERQFKPARDELRSAGAVIRYGFSVKPEVFGAVKLGEDAYALFGSEEDCM